MVLFFNKKVSLKWSLRKVLLSLYGIGPNEVENIGAYLGYPLNKNLELIRESLILAGRLDFKGLKGQSIFLRNLTTMVLKFDNFDRNLKVKEKRNIKKLIYIKHYRGVRHKKGLPVRGQRTRANAGTQFRIGKRFKNLK